VNIILLGPPGAGKGTQAINIAKKFNLNQISTGELLRNEIINKTDIGKEIENSLSKGNFVTDDVVNKLLKKIITNNNIRNQIIFDGYPRNISQAKNLDSLLILDNQDINYIFFLKVQRNIIEKRILERITCERCNKTFNETYNKNEIKKHECGEKYLVKRKDDNKEVLINRYDEYMVKTKPVLDFYSTRSYFCEIDASDNIEVISRKIEQILKG
tara:strand:- start:325 stop:966 length:642 start_codon:yes stop_codon:yes gene_type:complete